MALVRITNTKGDKLTVPAGAYKEIYKPQGWEICGESENTQNQISNDDAQEISGNAEKSGNDAPDGAKLPSNDDDENNKKDEELEQLKAKAEELEIEGFETMTKEELVAAIEEAEEDEDDDDEDLSEIPISEMTVPQLHKRASQLGIDVSNLNGAKALREAIKKAQNK